MSSFRFFLLESSQISADELFRISLVPPDEPLRKSLAAKGMLQPLLVHETAPKCYRLVTGFKRLQISRELGWPQVPALLVTDMDKDIQLYDLALSDRSASGRALNTLEMAMALYKLDKTFSVPRANIVQDYLPLLGLGKNGKLLDMYLPLAELDERSKIELQQDWLSLDFVAALVELPIAERHTLLDLFKSLRLGKNRQKEFFLLIRDASRLLDTDPGALLQQPVFQALWAEATLTLSQKVERVKAELMRLRYPQYSLAQQSFHDLLKAAHLPPTLRVQAPMFFSSDEYAVSFTFRDRREFQQHIQDLLRLADSGAIEKMVGLA